MARHAGQQLHAQGKARVTHQAAGFGGLPAAVMAFAGLQGRVGKTLDAQFHRAAAVAAQARQQGRIQAVGAGGAAETGDAAVTEKAVGHVQAGIQIAGSQGREGPAVKGQLYRRPALCPPGTQIVGRAGQYLVQRTGLLTCLVMLGTEDTATGTAEKRDENAEDRDCPCRSLPQKSKRNTRHGRKRAVARLGRLRAETKILPEMQVEYILQKSCAYVKRACGIRIGHEENIDQS